MLENFVRTQLCTIIKEYGNSIINDPRRCRGMLKDLSPNNPRETNLIILALEQKVVVELTQNKSVPVPILLDRLAQRLHDNLGIQKDFAAWAIESWVIALEFTDFVNANKVKGIDVPNVGLDECYQLAMDNYNQITDYGWEHRFNYEMIPKYGENVNSLENGFLHKLQPLFDQITQLSNIFKELQQLADKNYGKAYFPLARIYRGGRGICEDIEKNCYYSQLAFDWCIENQTLNDPEIWTALGWMYVNGSGVMQDDKKAVFWYRKAAELGYALAQNNLGRMYQSGLGVIKNENEAMLWYRKAADQGLAIAQFNLGWSYENGLDKTQDDDQSVYWYLKAAQEGHSRSENNLGWMYKAGRGVTKDNHFAVFWFSKSAEQGDSGGQCNLGVMYRDGLGIDQNDQQAVFWFRKSAEQSHANAQINLGYMYQYGRGVEQSDTEAVIWYRKAAVQGIEQARNNLNLLYEKMRLESNYKLIDYYHESISYGDTVEAAILYKVLLKTSFFNIDDKSRIRNGVHPKHKPYINYNKLINEYNETVSLGDINAALRSYLKLEEYHYTEYYSRSIKSIISCSVDSKSHDKFLEDYIASLCHRDSETAYNLYKVLCEIKYSKW